MSNYVSYEPDVFYPDEFEDEDLETVYDDYELDYIYIEIKCPACFGSGLDRELDSDCLKCYGDGVV